MNVSFGLSSHLVLSSFDMWVHTVHFVHLWAERCAHIRVRHYQYLSKVVASRPPWRCDNTIDKGAFCSLICCSVLFWERIQRKGVNWLFGDSAAQLKDSGVVIVLNYHHIQVEIRTEMNQKRTEKTQARTHAHIKFVEEIQLMMFDCHITYTLHKHLVVVSLTFFFHSVSFILCDTTIHASLLRASSGGQSKMKEFAFQ